MSQITGTGPSSPFTQPDGLALDGSGDLWVSDISLNGTPNTLVDKFDSAGDLLAQTDGTGSWKPSPSVVSLAWDAAAGKVFAGDGNFDDVWGLNPDGSYAGTDFNSGLGAGCCFDYLAADDSAGPTAGDLYVTVGDKVVRVDSSGNPVNFTAGPDAGTNALTGTGTPAGPFTGDAGLGAIAVDDAGNVYVPDVHNRVVDEFDSTGAFVRAFTGAGAPNPFTDLRAVAVDPTDGDVLIADRGGSDSLPPVIDEFSSTGTYRGQITGTDTPAGTLGSQFGGDQDGGGLSDIVVDAAGDVYASDGTDAVVNEFSAAQITPDVTTNAASSITATSATLNGHLDPAGGPDISACHFDWGTDTSYGHTVPCAEGNSFSAASDVHADITGLTAGTTYHYRLEATNANGTTDGSDGTFTTLPIPLIDSAAAQNLTGTAGDLTAQINPNGSDTTYHFEYGTSTGYGTSVPIPDADIGSGTTDVLVSQHITGLTANTEYHWRVVATNANAPGGVDSPDHTFIYDTTSTHTLPDGRAYEQVTPAHKNGALIVQYPFFGTPSLVADDGSRVIADTIQCFGVAASCTADFNTTGTPVAFTRTPSGWTSNGLAPPASLTHPSEALDYNPNTTAALFEGVTAPDGEADFYQRSADGSFTDLGPLTPPALGLAKPSQGSVESSLDESHVAFELANPSQLWPFDATDPTHLPTSSLYEYAGAGSIAPSLVGVSGGVGSTDLIDRCYTNLGGATPDAGGTGLLNALSSDGATVFFTAEACPDGGSGVNAGIPVPADTVYARINQSETALISGRSPDDCSTGSCQGSTPRDAEFIAASTDGSKAYFTSTQQLTDTASQDPNSGDSAVSPGCGATVGANGCNLYLYDFSRPAGHELVDVSAGDTSGGGPQVQGVMAVTPDGSDVYFVAKGVLTGTPNGQGQTARAGQDNLYAYDAGAGQTKFVAVLPSSDVTTGFFTPSTVSFNSQSLGYASATPDGRYLVFASHGQLTAGDSSSVAQIFRYDADTGQLIRISAADSGYNDSGNAGADDATIVPEAFARTMSDDGSYVFFEDPAALVPGALNNVQVATFLGAREYAQNVYEWHQGHVSLISDGKDASAIALPGGNAPATDGLSSVELLGTDATGANVFFTTADQLVPQDTDTQLDIYDARIGGGFPYTPPSQCVGDSCQGTPSTLPAPPVAATVLFSGPGNVTSARAGRVRMLRRTVRGSEFTMRVVVPGRGRVVISGYGVRSVRRRVGRAGAFRLRVGLTGREHRLLRREHRLRLWLRVSFAPVGGRVVRVSFSILDRA